MQYGHCVTCATATAMSCFILADKAPSANKIPPFTGEITGRGWVHRLRHASLPVTRGLLNCRGFNLDQNIGMIQPCDAEQRARLATARLRQSLLDQGPRL